MGALAGQGRFAVDWAPPGQTVGPETRSPHAMDLLCLVADGRLELSLTCDEAVVAPAQASRVLEALCRVLRQSADQDAGAATPTFSYPVSDGELDEPPGAD